MAAARLFLIKLVLLENYLDQIKDLINRRSVNFSKGIFNSWKLTWIFDKLLMITDIAAWFRVFWSTTKTNLGVDKFSALQTNEMIKYFLPFKEMS